MSAFMNDAVNVNLIADQLIHDAIRIHADLAHVLFADLGQHATDAWQIGERFNFIADVLNNARGIVR